MNLECKVKRQILLDLNEEEGFELTEEDLTTEGEIITIWEECGPDYQQWFDVDFGEYEDHEIPYSHYVEEYYSATKFARELPDGTWIRFDSICAIGLIDQSDLDLEFENYDVIEVEMMEETVVTKVFRVKK